MSSSDVDDSSDLQSWSEVPRIAHFCSLFRRAFDLMEFDIQELEESLLFNGSSDDSLQLVPRLVIKLLKGCSRSLTKKVNSENYNTYLKQLFVSKSEKAKENHSSSLMNPSFLVKETIFENLSLRSRVRVLDQLCEFRLEAEDVPDKVKNLEASSLRVNPLGRDSEGSIYWYFYGTRLYLEKLSSYKKRRGKKKKKKKEKKKKKKKNKESSSEEDEDDEEESSPWSLICLTLPDWLKLTEKMGESKNKHERQLHETLSENFIPEIQKMFVQKERNEKRRLLYSAPKRSSSRIEQKKAEETKMSSTLEKSKKVDNRAERFINREQLRNVAKEESDSSDSEKRITEERRKTMKRKRVESVSECSSSSLDDYTFSPPFPSSSPQTTKRSSFTNALLRAGTKSTKDSNLEARKTPEIAPKLSKQGTLLDNNSSDQKISFSLYEGHLPIDTGGLSKSSGLLSQSHETSQSLVNAPLQKVFSNWGGEFFKKNLDYRANTNKILEKMNLSKNPPPFKKAIEDKKKTLV